MVTKCAIPLQNFDRAMENGFQLEEEKRSTNNKNKTYNWRNYSDPNWLYVIRLHQHKGKDEDDRHIQIPWVNAAGRRRVLGVCYLAKEGLLEVRKLKLQHWTLKFKNTLQVNKRTYTSELNYGISTRENHKRNVFCLLWTFYNLKFCTVGYHW